MFSILRDGVSFDNIKNCIIEQTITYGLLLEKNSSKLSQLNLALYVERTLLENINYLDVIVVINKK